VNTLGSIHGGGVEMKILNLYAGIGGNRTLWGNDHEITAVEYDPFIAAIYKKRYPGDEVVVGDALEYLEKHSADFDFVWASPECPTHSRLRTFNQNQLHPIIPDMKSLYGLIIFFQWWYKGRWIVENVVPYYKYLIKPTVIIERHPFWSNFRIPPKAFPRKVSHIDSNLKDLCDEYRVNYEDIGKWEGVDKRKVLRNCVDYRVGKYLLECAMGKVKTLEAFV